MDCCEHKPPFGSSSRIEFGQRHPCNRQGRGRRRTVFEMPRCRQSSPCQNPLQESFSLQVRDVGDELHAAKETLRCYGGFQVRIAKQIGVVESTLPNESFRVNRKPSSFTKIKNIEVMNIAVQNPNIAWLRQQFPCYNSGGSEYTPMHLGSSVETLKPVGKPCKTRGRVISMRV